MTASVTACANMKGGVGKTTVATSLAEGSARLGRSVLVIDLDLQINASMTLVSERDGDEPWHRDRTVEDYLRARWRGDRPSGMSLVEQIDERLHLLSGRLSLVLFERELLTQNTAIFTVANHIGTWLRDLLAELRGYFDLIIIDTPPGLSILAECAIREADLIVVPQAPDRLSTLASPELRHDASPLTEVQGELPKDSLLSEPRAGLGGLQRLDALDAATSLQHEPRAAPAVERLGCVELVAAITAVVEVGTSNAVAGQSPSIKCNSFVD